MAHTRRGVKGGTARAFLNGDINGSVATIPCQTGNLSSWAGVNTNGPGTATINLGKTDEETVTFAAISGDSLTGVSRGAAGTTAQSHSSGATVDQTSSVVDADEANELVAAMANNRVRVYSDAAISVTNATFQALGFNQERYDTGNMHAGSSTRLTAVTAGLHRIGGCVECALNATGERILGVRLNGDNSKFVALVTAMPSAANPTRLNVSCDVGLSAADYVELMVYQSSGGFLNVSAVATYSPEFWMSWAGF